MNDEYSNVVRPGLWAQSKQMGEIKRKLRDKVPKITLFDIRMERQEFCEAILTDLYESGYQQSAQFIQNLIEIEEDFTRRNKSERFLTTNAGKRCIQTIAKYLKSSEMKLHEGYKPESIEDILELAQLLSNQEETLWIVEQIYKATVNAAKFHRLDGGLLEARVRYYYGRFLMEKCGLYDAAYEIFKISYDMSIAKDWSIKNESTDEKNLGREVSYLISLCLSKKLEGQSTSLAIEFSKKALKYAIASENKDIIPRAYLERGDREMDSRNYEEAANFFSKAITFAQVSSQSDFICQGYLKKGYAMQKSNQISRATTFAKLAKQAAEESGSSFYLAKSYVLYGDIAISRNLMNAAAYNFTIAADIFNDLGKFKLSREARFLGAFARSHIVLKRLVDLIRKSERNPAGDDFDKIVQWKERRIPFWNVDDKTENFKRVSDFSEFGRRNSTLTAFGYYESFSFHYNPELLITRGLGSNKHIYRKWREWFSTR